ncbi:MAG: hypothetical protein FVQ83_03060 [Chloroflexi bacterium]|nr:hypothetical protein [Chloroflexota bacterium]
MADINCPMCGESNPPELEVCQHCQARLKPLVPEDNEFPLDLPEEELPDWLSSLREDELPEIQPRPDDETLDWMASTDAASDPTLNQSSEIPEDDPEWLSNLRAAEPEIQLPQKDYDTSPPISNQDQDDPDWLLELRQRQEQEGGSSETGKPAEDTGDFMERIQDLQDNEVEAAGETSDQPEEAVLASLDAEDQPAEPSEDTSRDWLAGLSDEAQDLFQESAQSAEESPDWLAELGDSASETIQEPAQPAEESPDWLGDLADSASETIQEPAQPAEESPEWLAELGDSTPETIQEPVQPGYEPFVEIQQPVAEDSISSLLEETPAETTEDTPDWLPQAESSAEKTVLGQVVARQEEIDALLEDQPKASQGVDAESPDLPKKPGFVDTGSLPSWLVDLKRSEPSIPSVTPQTPALVSEEDSSKFSFQSDETEIGLTPAELPSWLSEETLITEEADELIYEAEESEASPEITPEIAPADLPTWVETMRPDVQEISATDEDAQTGAQETAGPLSGLRGVLPAEPEIVRFTKPPLYSIKLDVTENQNVNAALFEELIASESETLTPKRQIEALSQRILRLAIASLLFLSVLVPVLTESTSVASPSAATIPPETQQFFSLVNEFTSEISVLIAFDYQPGLSGEMNTAAAAVIDHLLLKGAQIATISTSPTGPALAANSLATTQPSHDYITQKLYRNLGFIAGGTSALRNLADNPREAVPINVLEGEELRSVWDMPPLQEIHTLHDFSLITVITDDPNTARAWIEQVQPTLDGTPLTLIISAQAEPLVRPYFETSPKQVEGIVTGILGAASYELLTGRTNLARAQWDAFSMGLGITVIVILAGGFASLATSILSQRQPKRSEIQK